MPLIKVAYLMLNFLNLKSFLSNLFFAVASSLSTLCTWIRRGGWVSGFQKVHTFPLRVEGWSLEFECPRGPKIWKKSRKYFIPLCTEKNIFQLLKLDYDKLLIINNVVPYGFERVLWVYLFFWKSIYLKTLIIHTDVVRT